MDLDAEAIGHLEAIYLLLPGESEDRQTDTDTQTREAITAWGFDNGLGISRPCVQL